MERIKEVAFTLAFWGLQLNAVQGQNCETKTGVSGQIFISDYFYNCLMCWTIPVPVGHYVHLQFNNIMSEHPCEHDFVRINIAGTNDDYKFCSQDNYKNPITAFSCVTVTHQVTSIYRRHSTFNLLYTLKTIECLNKSSFKCDNNSCVLDDKVCNGVKDCRNGADEIGCETPPGVLSVKGANEARQNAVSWLMSRRTPDWGWTEDTPRAVVALYLGSGGSFNGSGLEDQLMAKQTELKTAVAMLKPSLTNSELSMFIDALLVTCHNPRQFYGNDLVQRLKKQVEESGNFTHPLAYLALCNANEHWPLKATSDLNRILNNDSEYPFVKDLQAMSLIALACAVNRSRDTNYLLSSTTLELRKKKLEDLRNLQAQDGSFGNVHTTALITQALFASGQEHDKDSQLNETVQFLIKELNSPSVDFVSIYLVLPILNGKSLADISHVNCSGNVKKNEFDPISEVGEYLGPKIRVKYSLYIGDEKDVIHTISLRVPENYTAFKVMQLAQAKDPKYKFESKMTSGKMYVYKIGNLSNDPEVGKFWMLCVAENSSTPLTVLKTGPDKVNMVDGEHLVLWYKTATI